MKRLLIAVSAFALAASLSPAAQAVSRGQIDTFSGSLQGWFAGGGPVGAVPPVPPQVVASGGPAGAGDPFMLITANGSAGPGGRLVAMNVDQWAGNYTSAGVTGVGMDLRNFGNSDLTIRLLFEDPIAGPPQDAAVTTTSFALAAGGNWTHVFFPVAATDLTVLAGDAATLLSHTTVMRIFYGVAADFPGAPVAGLLGVDNIAAVPEPNTGAMLLAGLGVLGALARRSRRRVSSAQAGDLGAAQG